jgi:hypothetical protein
MPGNARQEAAIRPTAIAVHNHCNVPRQTGEINLIEQLLVARAWLDYSGKVLKHLFSQLRVWSCGPSITVFALFLGDSGYDV